MTTLFILHRGSGTVLAAAETELVVVRDDQLERFNAMVDAEDIDGALLSAAVTAPTLDPRWTNIQGAAKEDAQ